MKLRIVFRISIVKSLDYLKYLVHNFRLFRWDGILVETGLEAVTKPFILSSEEYWHILFHLINFVYIK